MKTGRRAALAALAATALGIAAPGAAPAKTVVAEGEHDRAYVLKGQTLRVKVSPGNSGSTGYHWHARHKEQGVLRLRSQRTSRDGGFQVFTYRALRPGNAYLKFRYMPPGPHRGRRAAERVLFAVGVNRRFRAKGCRPRGSETVLQNSQARVFKLRRAVYAPFGGKAPWRFKGWFGCAYAQDRAFALDGAASNNPERSIPKSGTRYYEMSLKGTKFGHAWFGAGPELQPYNDGVFLARTFDLAKRKLIRSAYPDNPQPGMNNPIRSLVMSPSGGLAWIEVGGWDRAPYIVAKSDQPPRSSGRVARDRTVLDHDVNHDVDRDSLRLEGGDVTWLRGGDLKRAPLR